MGDHSHWALGGALGGFLYGALHALLLMGRTRDVLDILPENHRLSGRGWILDWVFRFGIFFGVAAAAIGALAGVGLFTLLGWLLPPTPV